MSFKHLARLTKDSLSAHREVNFIWHGGEPLLLGIEWFEKAIALQGLMRNESNVITNSLQTNGLLLDDSWVEFLKANNFSVGVSVDGPKLLHDKARVDAKGKGTYAGVIAALSKLRSNEIPHGVLIVVTDSVVAYGADRLYEWIKSEKIDSIGLLPQRPDTEDLSLVRAPSASSKFLSRDAYAEFLRDVAKLWWKDDGRGPRIRELETFVSGLIQRKPGICIYQGSCVGKYFGVDPNGDVYHCDRYIPERAYVVGNLSSPNWIDRNRLSTISANALSGEQKSQKCKWYAVCHGGCPHDRHADKGGWADRGNCCGMSEVINYLSQEIEGSIPEHMRPLLTNSALTWQA